jgi:uncharacterized protein (DUF433 family)
LGWLAAGATQEQILEDYPDLEVDDFRAVFAYALKVGKPELRADLPGSEILPSP